MTNVEILDGRRDASSGYKVDVSLGGHNDRVSSEWFSRPDDEKFLSLSELYASVKGRAERSRRRTVSLPSTSRRRIQIIDSMTEPSASPDAVVSASENERSTSVRSSQARSSASQKSRTKSGLLVAWQAMRSNAEKVVPQL